MAEVIRGEQYTGDEARINAGAVLRYSAIFAGIVVPASFIMLELPALVLATWVVARRIARKYRRQITTREIRQLAVASWAWMVIAWLLRTGVHEASLSRVAFDLPWKAVEFATVWLAYVWLARFVIRRTLGLPTPVEEARSASQMLAQQEERYTEARARSLALTLAWPFVGLFLLLPAGLLVVVIIAVVLGLLGLQVSDAVIVVSVVLGPPALLAGWAYVIQRKSAAVFPSHRLVLWLRRFHQADLMEFPFPAFLEQTCRGIAVPITLQDSTVSTARTAAQRRPVFYVLTAVTMASWWVLAGSVMTLWGSESWGDPQALFLGAAAAGALAALIVTPLRIRRLGALHLGTKRGQRLVKRLLDAIDSKEGVPQTLTVISTPDASWQSWVLQFMQRADAVLIDVTHLSEHLHWELRAIAGHLEAEQLILAYGEPEGRHEGIPRDTLAELAGLLGEGMLERSHRFVYTLPRHRWWGGLPHLALLARSQKGWLQPPRSRARLYAQQLADALQKAFAASDARTTRATSPTSRSS